MKAYWTFHWWDLLALAGALLAAVLVVQYGVSRNAAELPFPGPAMVQVRVNQLLPELAKLIVAGDILRNHRGEKIGRVLSAKKIENNDWLIAVEIEKPLRLTRDLPRFPREPVALKAGVWCLLATDKIELSGLVVGVENKKR